MTSSLVCTIVSWLHLSHAVVLANDSTSLLCLDLCNLNLALPVLVLTLLLGAIVSLLDEVEGLGHVFLGTNLSIKLTLFVLKNRDFLLSLLDVSELLDKTILLDFLVLEMLGGLALSLSQILFQLGQLLGRRTCRELQLDELPVALLNLLNVLLVSDLHLMEINKLEVITKLLLLLDLGLGLEDGHFQSDVLLSELLNLRLFL